MGLQKEASGTQKRCCKLGIRMRVWESTMHPILFVKTVLLSNAGISWGFILDFLYIKSLSRKTRRPVSTKQGGGETEEEGGGC